MKRINIYGYFYIGEFEFHFSLAYAYTITYHESEPFLRLEMDAFSR